MLAFVCRVHADRLHGSQWEEIKGNSAGSKARLQLVAILSAILVDIYDHGTMRIDLVITVLVIMSYS